MIGTDTGCNRTLALFLAGMETAYEGCEWLDDFTLCDSDRHWFLDFINEYCLYDTVTMNAGTAAEIRRNLFEVIPASLNGRASESVALRTKLDRIAQEVATWRREGYRNNSIWLYHMVEGEAGLRRSLVHGIVPQDGFIEMPADNAFHLRVNPEIERHFCWESPSPVEYNQHENPSAFHGTTYTLPAPNGTEHGRIAVAQIRDLFSGNGDGINDGFVDPLANLWVGIKEDAGCGLDEWSPLIELELGDVAANLTSAVQADPNASGGQMVRFTADNCQGELSYLTVTLEQAFGAGANFNQWRGEYIVLLRARADVIDGEAYNVRIRAGWQNRAGKKRIGDSLVIDSTAYAWYPMGVVSIPDDAGRVAASNTVLDNLGAFGFDIVVEKTENAPPDVSTLDLDALYLIPYEHHSVLEIADVAIPPIYTRAVPFGGVRLFTHENDATAYRYNGATANALGQAIIGGWSLTQNNFYLPMTETRFVMAANTRRYDVNYVGGLCEPFDLTASITGSTLQTDLTWQTRLNFLVFERWLSLRDA
jgi:hypothetical protein